MMKCPDPDEVAPKLLNALRRGCSSFSEVLREETADCRTPTKMNIPNYFSAMLGDRIGRLMNPDDFQLVKCWCELSEGRLILAVALGRIAMSFPRRAFEIARDLERCGEKELLSRFVYPIVAIWDPRILDSLDRYSYLMSWAWLASYVPEDFDEAMERVMLRSDILDEALIKALKRLRKVNPARTYERIKDMPYLLRRVIP